MTALKRMAETGTYEAEVYRALDESGLLDECREAWETVGWRVIRSLTPTADDLRQPAGLAELAR